MFTSTISSWNSKALLLGILFLLPRMVWAQSPADAFTNALTQHGGAAVDAVSALQITGTSTDSNGTSALTITAEFDGRIRFDYGQPVTRSLVQTSQGQFVLHGTRVEPKQAFVGVFGAVDMLSIFGLRRLETESPTWIDGGTAVDAAGHTVFVRNVSTGQQQRHYGRLLTDQFQIAFDAQSGLVSSVTRQQYSDNSLDVVFPVTYRFSDYRTFQNIVFPYRIDKYVFGRLAETIVVTGLQLNPAVSTATFER